MADVEQKSRQTRSRTGRTVARRAPELINHRKVADMLGITTKNIRRWVAKGSFPEPHSVIETVWLYRSDQVRTFLATGKWPEGTKFKRARPRDRGDEPV
jgi:predicted DNA-binding transcriptional regulator AlpA